MALRCGPQPVRLEFPRASSIFVFSWVRPPELTSTSNLGSFDSGRPRCHVLTGEAGVVGASACGSSYAQTCCCLQFGSFFGCILDVQLIVVSRGELWERLSLRHVSDITLQKRNFKSSSEKKGQHRTTVII